LGLTCPVIGSDGWDDPQLIKLGGKDMDGAYFTNHYSPDVDRPVAKKFIAQYQKKYKMLPDAAAALTYDSAYILFNAIAKAGKVTPKAIRDAIAATKGFAGVTGDITYNGSGDPVKGAVVIRIENGKFVFDSAVNP
jgi:branched-chain amino acid transport system substrate-binding protein